MVVVVGSGSTTTTATTTTAANQSLPGNGPTWLLRVDFKSRNSFTFVYLG